MIDRTGAWLPKTSNGARLLALERGPAPIALTVWPAPFAVRGFRDHARIEFGWIRKEAHDAGP